MFIKQSQNPDGGWPQFKSGASDAWSTAEAILLCSTMPKLCQKNMHRGIEWLIRNRFKDGGWSSASYGKGIVSDVCATAYALIAINNYGTKMEHSQMLNKLAKEATKWLIQAQQPNGGWGHLSFKDESLEPHIGPTAFALRALAYAPKTTEVADAIQNGLYFIQRWMINETGWPYITGQELDVTMSCYVLRALIDIEVLCKHHFKRSIYENFIKWVLSIQNPNGSWSDWQGILNSIEATAYVLEIISSLIRKPLSYSKVKKSINFILSSQNNDGSWPQDPEDPKSCIWVTHNVGLALHSLYSREFNKPSRICKFIELRKEQTLQKFKGVPIKNVPKLPLLRVENFLPFLRRAIELAKLCKSEDEKIRPKVGAVIVKDNRLLAEGYRNEDGKGTHAELCALMKCRGQDVEGAILITTMEPCTIGDHRIEKIRGPCALYISQFKIKGVIYGILDYNPSIEKSFEQFISSYYPQCIVERFPYPMRREIEELNKEYIEACRRKSKKFKLKFDFK